MLQNEYVPQKLEFGDHHHICLDIQYDLLGQLNPQRVSDKLQLIYDLEEGSGNYIFDISGVGDPLDLEIIDPQNTTWNDHSIEINTPTKAYNLTNNNKLKRRMFPKFTFKRF